MVLYLVNFFQLDLRKAKESCGSGVGFELLLTRLAELDSTAKSITIQHDFETNPAHSHCRAIPARTDSGRA
jgi:hypothetical protein